MARYFLACGSGSNSGGAIGVLSSRAQNCLRASVAAARSAARRALSSAMRRDCASRMVRSEPRSSARTTSSWFEDWIAASLALYVLTGACWLPVVWIQIRMRDLARAAAASGAPLPPLYHRLFAVWFACGIPAFPAVTAIFALMIFRPSL